jgi:hypothetical protein
MAEQSISIQGFTRVHMVPRVNQGQTVALAFELPSAPPVAYGAPVQVLQQLFLRIPQVLADAKKVRAEAGLVDAPDAPAIAAVPWVVESVAAAGGADDQFVLTVHMNGCRVDLSFTPELVLGLGGLLASIEKPKTEPKKAPTSKLKVEPKKEAIKVASAKKPKAEKVVKAAATPPKAKPIAKTATKSKTAK